MTKQGDSPDGGRAAGAVPRRFAGVAVSLGLAWTLGLAAPPPGHTPRQGFPALTAIAAPSAGAAPAPVGPARVGPVSKVSRCPGQNAEVEEATAPPAYVYQVWIGCQGGFSPGGIAFARSTDGGRSYGRPRLVPQSLDGDGAWDPAIAVAPNGFVYVAYMLQTSRHAFPVVAVSTNHGL